MKSLYQVSLPSKWQSEDLRVGNLVPKPASSSPYPSPSFQSYHFPRLNVDLSFFFFKSISFRKCDLKITLNNMLCTSSMLQTLFHYFRILSQINYFSFCLQWRHNLPVPLALNCLQMALVMGAFWELELSKCQNSSVVFSLLCTTGRTHSLPA